jgi:DNA polymerase elongation subunit (family B)
MSYIDAIHDQRRNLVKVVERDENGNRRLVDYPADYVFYYSHPAGSSRSIYGDQCRKYSTNDGNKFKKELRRYEFDTDKQGRPKYKIFEKDINPIFRCLADNYRGAEAPKLHLGFFDIETGFCQKRGFAPPADPFNPITAISIYLSSVGRCVTLALKPNTYTRDDAQGICESFEDTFLFEDECEMLRTFLQVIEDVDVLTGWNSTLFDIPYVVNRIIRLMDVDTTRDLCLWGQKPRQRMIPRFGKEHESYDLVGRCHLDYLELYQKHNPQQMHSYRLDYIGEAEVGENKVAYEGTLDDLYHKDFYKFVEYSRQDVMLMVKIDAKKQFIELANQIAHVNSVLLKTTLGSVTLVEQAIINEMHDMGLVVPNRKVIVEDEFVPTDTPDDDDDEENDFSGKAPVVGAYVAKPKKGIATHVGCVDINSLYPSAIRALNISPETIVGQIRSTETKALIAERIAAGTKRAEAWDGLFSTVEFQHMLDRSGAPIWVDFDDGTERQMSGRQLHDYIFEPKNHLCITANGTIFKTKNEGIIPQLLEKWYVERQTMQGMKKAFASITKDGLKLSGDLADAVSAKLENG